jgi:transposase
MIVVGVDVHKHSLSAVAVDEVGRQLDAVETSDAAGLLAWSKRVGQRRLWALEDCRHVTRGLERTLQRHRQRLVRVPPRLKAPERTRGRVRGKSDLIDALAIARAALREPRLDSPHPEEASLRELKLLVDHRDDLVDERRRAQQRLRWHLHELNPSLRIPLGALDRAVWLERLGRQLSRHEQATQVRIARELISRCRALTRSILELDRELHSRTTAIAPRLLEFPGCAAITPPSCCARSVQSIASELTHTSPATPASHPSTPAAANTNATASTAAATASSTAPSTASPSPKAASTHQRRLTSSANRRKARAAAKPSAASNDSSPAASTAYSSTRQCPLDKHRSIAAQASAPSLALSLPGHRG